MIATFLLFGSISYAQAAINYLVLEGTVGGARASPTISLTARIQTSCPASVPNYGYKYYGIRVNYLEGFDVNSPEPTVPVGSATVCVVGVPNSIVLQPVGSLNQPSVTLNVGDSPKNLTPYGWSIGILMPDSTTVGISLFTNGYTLYASMGSGHSYTSGSTKFLGTFIYQTNMLCGMPLTGSGVPICANYVLGY